MKNRLSETLNRSLRRRFGPRSNADTFSASKTAAGGRPSPSPNPANLSNRNRHPREHLLMITIFRPFAGVMIRRIA